MKSVHLNMSAANGIGLKGLTLVARDQHIYESCCLGIFGQRTDIESLVGGWIYLHPVSKNSPSEFGWSDPRSAPYPARRGGNRRWLHSRH